MPSLRSHEDAFLAEICGQPDAVRRAAASFETQRADLEPIREAASRAKTIIFTGMGSSYDACYPAVNDLAGRGVPSLLVDTAELLHFRRAVLGPDTLVVIVSQSGESAEIVGPRPGARSRPAAPRSSSWSVRSAGNDGVRSSCR